MRALLAALNCPKGDVEGNLAAHLRVLRTASPGDLVLFPEMSLTGSVDPAVRPDRLISLDHHAILALAQGTKNGVGACYGIAERGPDGAPYITQIFAAGGRIAGVQRKRHLGEGEEAFVAATDTTIFDHDGIRFGVAICAESGFDAPFDCASAADARLVLFPAAPGLYGRRSDDDSWRAGLTWWESCGLADACRHAKRLGLWIAMAGQAGVTEDEDFPGLAALVGPDGQVADRLADWHPGVLEVEIGTGETGTVA
jgi:predicted amidohydrolase